MARERRSGRDADPGWLARHPRELRAGTIQSVGLSSERARRWGVRPSYYGWQGDLVETSLAAEEAILRSLGANKDRPPRRRRLKLTDEKCAPAPNRAWGWAIQLYALRSRDSWGVGDLADLRRFARWSRRQGASCVLLNPLGAQRPILPYEPSPYFASSRRFRNVLYLRVEEIHGADAVDISAERDSALRLNTQRLIDYNQVFLLKSRALRKVHAAAPNPAGLAGWCRRQGSALYEFAVFNAQRSAESSVELEMWMQFHVDRQLARASREIGLITDVPVGFAPDGFDASRW
ncbi:MAG TPA: 4-alpha-glucanotransferase, partial [Candidatus Dormibacteraeota bacterium]|nr:4-alpha-glucanotransferase [Candidatus Dormibacteraeota bacterium]